MSDYLWDKTGEPDAETERLENLLGQLRFQPTPFDLPAELPTKLATNELRAVRARNVLSWPRLAVAASIALAVLLGAWVMLRQQTGTSNDKQQVAEQNNQTGTDGKQSAASTTYSTPGILAHEYAHEANPTKASEKAADPAAARRGGETPREERAGGRPQPRLPDLANNTSRRLPRAVAPRDNRNETVSAPKREKNLARQTVDLTRREEMARAERDAAEKVLYALRVTSENLNYARQQVQVSGRGDDNR